ncbi:MAG: REP-associated tyrosine transposase [Thermoanaerobaculia bacterium]|jgi:putative transposase|nr:REP-associated tyrosine transposase [Thermoanaerobaculia bacterium]
MDWPHAPLHRFGVGEAIWFVTASTYLKLHHYRNHVRLEGLQSRVFELCRKYDCHLQAWAIFSNHYHLVVNAVGDALRSALTELHTNEGLDRNRDDNTPRRQVWFQFRETQLTYERSWLARLRYTHQNAVHHGLVSNAAQYRWCSASWFETNARPSFVKVVNSFKIDRVNVPDDFDVELS